MPGGRIGAVTFLADRWDRLDGNCISRTAGLTLCVLLENTVLLRKKYVMCLSLFICVSSYCRMLELPDVAAVVYRTCVAAFGGCDL